MTVKEYKIKNKELFERWKTKHFQKYGKTSFVSDGIVNFEKWFSTDIPEERIMFLLKEAYDKSETPIIWDEAKWLNQENAWKTVHINRLVVSVRQQEQHLIL